MPGGVSIHLGVNRPAGPHASDPLRHSEDSAWKMAKVALEAGYDAVQVLRGAAATRDAVHDALTRAAGALKAGETLFVSYSGHGSRVRDENRDERSPYDQGWCLADGLLVDDKLLGYWRLFEPGVRIVLVVESCYSGGMGREDQGPYPSAGRRPGAPVMRGGLRHRGPAWRSVAVADYGSPCIAEPPMDADGIRASLLMLAASTEDQTSRDGLFSEHLLKVWDEGRFPGTFCDLYRAVRAPVTRDHCSQEPQILMLGAPDPGFPQRPAFHLDRQDTVYRGS